MPARKSTARTRKAAAPQAPSPKDLLYPLQRRWVDDRSQYKIAVTSRQWGKSTVTAGEAVHDAITDPGTKWVCMSAGERQSLEWLAKAKEWLAAYRMAIEGVAEDRGGLAEGLLRATEITLANGSRIIAIPANPSTARGYSANVILDEFAYHEDPDAIWSAMFPASSNALAGTFMDRWRALLQGGEPGGILRHQRVRVVSTFNGRANKFYQLWEGAPENGFVPSRVTIHDAIADGMPLDAERLRAALDDPDAWAQEFECEPIDASTVLLPYDLIATCEAPEATRAIGPDWWASAPMDTFLGIDFGRRRDLTVCWTLERMGDVAATRELVELRDTPTPDQIDILRHRIRAARRVALDYTGPGIGMGDYLVREFGQWAPDHHKYGKIELVTFTAQRKRDLFSKLRMAFERRGLRVPIDRAIREDLHSVHRTATAAGEVNYRAPHTEDGHADRCTALALALHAAGELRAWSFAPRPASASRRTTEARAARQTREVYA